MKRILQLLGLFWKPISLNAAFFAFMYALGYYCTQTEIQLHLRGAVPYKLSASELFFDVYLLCALLALIPRIVRKWVRLVVAVLLYAIALIDVFCYVRFESTLTPTMLMLFFETNGREAGEFLKSFVGWDLFTSLVGGVLLIALLHIVWSVLRFWQRRRRWMGPRLSKPALLVGNALMGLLAAVLLGYCTSECWANKQAMMRLLTKQNLGEVEHELTTREHAILYLPVHRMAFSLRANQLASQQISTLVGHLGEAQVDSCDFRSPQIVLIIGESFNRYRSQLYGYDHETTPRQLERMRDSSLVAFTDVVAPWNLTSFVFKHVFSLYTVGDKGDWCDAPLFPEVFRRAGYHVTFITNQFMSRAGEQVYDFSGGFFLNNPQLSNALFDERNQRTHPYDDGVLADYDAMIKKQRHEHQLTIFHLMGQHVDYLGRFPRKSRRHFKPADYHRDDLTEEKQQINADYDNAVLYNDSIVDQILRRFEQENAIVIYMPDHGEECFNDSMGFYGRLHSAEIDRRLAREEFEIPFWIWASEQYRNTHPYGWMAIRRYSQRPYMIDRLPHTLLFLGGIHTPLYRKELDVLNADYDEHRPRLLKGKTDYDQLRIKK
ncbi:MAG: sulfatase-like hydrolase/transferase [Prevotella sp.]|nr:sulfatase-like hydrolase/transferase [Prevotella sp.]